MRTGFTVLDSLTLSVLDYATGDTVAITTDRATVAQWRDDDVLPQRLAEKGHPTALRLLNRRSASNESGY